MFKLGAGLVVLVLFCLAFAVVALAGLDQRDTARAELSRAKGENASLQARIEQLAETEREAIADCAGRSKSGVRRWVRSMRPITVINGIMANTPKQGTGSQTRPQIYGSLYGFRSKHLPCL